jgi:hypothetical protein
MHIAILSFQGFNELDSLVAPQNIAPHRPPQ